MHRLRVLLVVATMLIGSSLAAAGNGSSPKGEHGVAAEPTQIDEGAPANRNGGALLNFGPEDGRGGVLHAEIRTSAGVTEIFAAGPFGNVRHAAFAWLSVALGGEGNDSIMTAQFHARDLGGGTWRCAAVSFQGPTLPAGASAILPESLTVRLALVSNERANGVTNCAIHSAPLPAGPQPMIAGLPDVYNSSHFALVLDGKDMGGSAGFFKSIEGGAIEAEVVEYQEGGVNNVTKHMRPSRWGGILLSDLTLTRCVPGGDPTWNDWFDAAANPNGPPPKAEVVFSFRNAQNQTLLTLDYSGVLPVSYVSDPASANSDAPCETLVLSPGSLRVH